MDRISVKKRDLKLSIAYIQLLLTSFFWAISNIIIKAYITKIPIFHFLMARFAFGILFIILISPQKLLSIKKSDIKLGLPLASFIFFSYILYTIGVKYTSASKSGFLAALSVLFIPIFESIFKKRLPSKQTMISVLFSIVGLILISGINGGSFNIGDLLIICCSLLYTFYIIALDRFGNNKDENILTLVQLILMFIVSFVCASCFEGLNFKIITENIFPLIILGVLGSGMTMILQTKAQKVASSESVGIILLGEPIFTLIMSSVILHEIILFKGVIGCVLLLFSLVIAIIKKV